jgi:catechol-2,3-dioxygenase
MTDDARKEAQRPARVALGAVHLTVSGLDRSLEYYTRSVGLQLLGRDGRVASLGAGGTELLVLVEEPGARREGWEGQVAARMTTLPLDTDSLLGELDDPHSTSFDGLPTGTTMGHVHLSVADIPSTVAFYRDALGLDLMAQLGPRAAFLAANGYHHHVGANTWESAGASPPPPGTAALRHATVVLPDRGELDAALERLERHGHSVSQTAAGPLVRDPSGNALLLVTGSPATRHA